MQIEIDKEGKAVCASQRLRRACSEGLLGLSCKDWSGAPPEVLSCQYERAQREEENVAPVKFEGSVVPVRFRYRKLPKGHIVGKMDPMMSAVEPDPTERPESPGLWAVKEPEFGQVLGAGCPKGRTHLWRRIEGWAGSQNGLGGETYHEEQNGMKWKMSAAASRHSDLYLEYNNPMF